MSASTHGEVLRLDGVGYCTPGVGRRGRRVPSRRLLTDVSLSVARGESVAVMGPSGSGKSTLLAICLGMLRPSEGVVRVAGADVGRLRHRDLARLRAESIGVVFQAGELLPELSPLDNVALPAMLAGGEGKSARARAADLLMALGVDAAHTPTLALSGGERQRVAVARALINEPQLVLADEPTGSLDGAARDSVANHVFGLPGRLGCALLVVTHDERVAARAGATRWEQIGEAPIALVRRGDWLSDGLQHELMLVVSHRPDVLPPPGLPRWPEPGEVFHSPQPTADGAGEGIGTRYGRTVGQIGSDGLSAVDERVAYVGVSKDDVSPTSVSLYEGWGGRTAQPWWSLSLRGWGESGFVNPAAHVLAVIVVLGLVPASILLLAARRVGAEQLQRRESLVDALGCPASLRAAMRLGEVATPLLVALAFTAAALTTMVTAPLRLPLVDYLLPAACLRQHWVVLAATALAGLTTAMACLVLGRPRRARGATRPIAAAKDVAAWTVVISPIGLYAATWVPTWLDPTGRAVWQLTYTTCVLVFLVGLPLGLTVVLRSVSRGVRSVSRRRVAASGAVRGKRSAGARS